MKPSNNPVFAGIDFGTSSIKICLFNLSGTLLKESSAKIFANFFQKSFSEIDLESAKNEMLQLLKATVSGLENQVVSIGFSVTSPTLVLFDSQLNPVRNGVLYLDNRSEKEVEIFAEALGGREGYFRRVGNSPAPSTCLPGILHWLKKNEPKSWEKTYKFGYLNSYMAAALTGKLAADPTTVSYSGLAPVSDPYHWDEKLVSLARIEPEKLPDIIPCFEPVGTLTDEMADLLGLSQETTVALGSADTAAASLALGLCRHGDTFDSVGTSEVFTVCLDKPAPHRAFMNRCHAVPGLWLAHGAISTAGAAINWIRRSVFPELSSLDLIENEALQSDAGADSLIFLPYLSGERSPVFDPDTCGVIFGLNVNSRRKDIVRAVYEGPGYGIRQLYDIAKSAWDIHPDFIRCVGGASRSRLVRQIRSDLVGLPYVPMEVANASAYGAAMLGAAAAGYCSIYDIPVCKTSSEITRPDAGHRAVYEKNYAIYNSLYPCLKELMHLQKED